MKLFLPLILLSVLTFLSIHRRHRANADSSCPKNCRPHVVQVHCNKTTGECSEGCITGFFGLTCNKICQCGGGACALTDGTCMQTPTEKPVPVNQGHQCKDCQTDGYIVGISVVCVVLVILTTVFILIIKFKRVFKESSGQQGNGQEGNPMLSDNNQSEPLEPLPDTEKKLLAQVVGVHVLYHCNESHKPVFLYCVHMKFDYRRVNTSKAHITRERYLVNEPEKKSKIDQFPESFKRFSGTTSLSPTIHGDFPTYWEVHTHIHLNNRLRPTDLLLCVGFCIENERNKDECPQTPFGVNCYNLNVGFCSNHEQICTKIYQGGQIEPLADTRTNIENKEDQNGDLKYGILVCKSKKVIVYFNVVKMERLASLENVDFRRPLWPMFGVFERSKPKVHMKLVTGRGIDMSQNKKDMILKALSSVKCDQ